MFFNSIEYAIFLPIVLLIYYSLNRRAQNIFLIFASYFFYGWWNPKFLTLIFISTLLDYFSGLLIYNSTNLKKKKLYLCITLVGNLTILGIFKYYNFFTSSLVDLFNIFGIHLSIPTLKVILPAGISFYTFQSMSYTIDVYFKKIKPTRDFLDFMLYVCYFPQLVAGPIERAGHLIPQFESERKVDFDAIVTGLYLIIFGLFKKIVIADNLAVIADKVFNDPVSQSSGKLLAGVYAFAIQVYCDFSGYSDIARGSSRLFGIDIMENFKTPFFAKNITEFWQRWHISLTTWLMDYIYLPLVWKSRIKTGKLKIYQGLIITFLLAGLWHGANWTFVVFGCLNGIYLVIHKFIITKHPTTQPVNPSSVSTNIIKVLKIFFTFNLFAITAIFFRAKNLPKALCYFENLLSFKGSLWIGFDVAFIIFIIYLIDFPQWLKSDQLAIIKLNKSFALIFSLLLLLSIYFLGITHYVPFIYFFF